MPCARYPEISRPCPQLPDIPADAPQVWCTLCAKPVHNLSALTEAAREELLSRPGPLCVSYRASRRSLAALAAGALLLSVSMGSALAQDDTGADEDEMDRVLVVGGGIRLPPPESVFAETESTDTAQPPEVP